MNGRAVATFALAVCATVIAMVGLAGLFEMSGYVPSWHYEIGWIVTLLGCGWMVLTLRASMAMNLLASVAFLVAVRYSAFYLAYALLESGVLWGLV